MESGVVTDLVEYLGGAWSVRRVVNHGVMRFDGVARFAPIARGELTWSEIGQLRTDTHEGPASRAYLITRAGRAWEVRFEDGRPFHPLDLRDGRCDAEHLCGADVYRGVYEVLEPDRFAVRWRVTGPGRDDVIASEYRRGPVTPGES